ncbi:hypothetical protein RRU94_18525 [Domibacillus sp. DTU_2020_1001157_1_SI_ALB_TIR_016]|uniref:hypothetical protein n=1 Tax=Domibacillus sp. DTU_2020_1001157_1_SI_ALB_TIR_016 TaxID=3077789 RepID=UPI0028E46857|nr:hypothetical protein [Domibacillus sp. DTU_2020_1001157_1_SI_ALB_TIR_016]WNS79524.1 hypothetical protein RRU94_18525 [Domibacillus sp. DTU_2020_1001157_1_SI_ALB_TIR_016]
MWRNNGGGGVNWDDIRSEWETTKIMLAALTEKQGIKLSTLKTGKAVKDGRGIQRKRMQPKVDRLQPFNKRIQLKKPRASTKEKRKSTSE